jgi:glutamate N-acetyltransferase / amino-acid N-acetyltransferase
MKILTRAVLPKGFLAHALSCGIKRSGGLDLALLYSVVPAQVAALFTTNRIQAAPVKLCRSYLKKRTPVRAVVINSGNANCFTGAAGMRDALSVSRSTAALLGVPEEEAWIASTGIIGRRLPEGKIHGALPQLIKGLNPRGIGLAKKAIMTTDSLVKESTVRCRLGSRTVTVSGIAKGAGMIAPRMATMLAFVMTDAAISRAFLARALREAVEDSFNSITVDGCMSTNDTVMVIANGEAGNRRIFVPSRDYASFRDALRYVCLTLAKLMVKDGEGASKFITIRVRGARSRAEARKVGLAVANSSLFKCAMYGEDPNFGRVIAAAGACGVPIAERAISVVLGNLKRKDISVEVRLSRGSAEGTVYTSDLTPEYVKINADYS